MSENGTQARSIKLVDEFIQSLSETEDIDQDVVAIIHQLHKKGRLTSRRLLGALAKQREELQNAQDP